MHRPLQRTFVSDELLIEVTPPSAREALSLVWRGRGRSRIPSDTVGRFLATALDAAAMAGVTLRMRLVDVEHANSSTIACIVELVRAARGRRVCVELIYASHVVWQRSAFEALRVLAGNDELVAFHAEDATPAASRTTP